MTTERYFKLGYYSESIVDIIITGTTNTLHLNLPFYQEGPDGNIHLTEPSSHSKGRDVYLSFMNGPQNTTHKPYNAMLLHVKFSQLSFSGNEQACDRGKDDVGRQIPTIDHVKKKTLSMKLLT